MLKTKIEDGSTVAIKLSTGEEIIGRLVSQNAESITLKKPMAFLRMQQSMGLMPFMATPEPDAEIELPRKFIVVVTKCEKSIAKQYIETTSGIKLASNSLDV